MLSGQDVESHACSSFHSKCRVGRCAGFVLRNCGQPRRHRDIQVRQGQTDTLGLTGRDRQDLTRESGTTKACLV